MLTCIKRMFWIVKEKSRIKSFITKCVTCRRQRAAVSTQLMGNLPVDRVRPTHPFLHSGVDYAGPFLLKTSRHRGYKSFKGYFAVFVCMSTKTVHLEAVSSYDAESFIAAFKYDVLE